MSYEDKEKLFEEESQHAKRGACLALFIFPPIVCFLLWIVLAFTAEGQNLASRGYLYFTYRGIPIHNLTQGFPGIARAGCQLDRQDPKPRNYEALQERYAEYYSTLVKRYRDSWQHLQANGVEIGEEYEDPERIPGDLARGKQVYCR